MERNRRRKERKLFQSFAMKKSESERRAREYHKVHTDKSFFFRCSTLLLPSTVKRRSSQFQFNFGINNNEVSTSLLLSVFRREYTHTTAELLSVNVSGTLS